jgi:hypothetical protein
MRTPPATGSARGSQLGSRGHARLLPSPAPRPLPAVVPLPARHPVGGAGDLLLDLRRRVDRRPVHDAAGAAPVAGVAGAGRGLTGHPRRLPSLSIALQDKGQRPVHGVNGFPFLGVWG